MEKAHRDFTVFAFNHAVFLEDIKRHIERAFHLSIVQNDSFLNVDSVFDNAVALDFVRVSKQVVAVCNRINSDVEQRAASR